MSTSTVSGSNVSKHDRTAKPAKAQATALSALLKEIPTAKVAEIRRLDLEVRTSESAALDAAIKCGKLLIEATAAVAHGFRMPVAMNLINGSKRSAQVYMRLAKHETAVLASKANTIAAASQAIAKTKGKQARTPAPTLSAARQTIQAAVEAVEALTHVQDHVDDVKTDEQREALREQIDKMKALLATLEKALKGTTHSRKAA
jgi:hypothetical protein